MSKKQFRWHNRREELSGFREALDTFRERKTDFNKTQIVEAIQKISTKCKKPYIISVAVLCNAINGDPERHFGYDRDHPYGLLWLTIAFMIGRTHSVIPTEEALNFWLYQICPNHFITDEGRIWIAQEAPKLLRESLGISAWPLSEVITEPSIPSFSVATFDTQPMPVLSTGTDSSRSTLVTINPIQDTGPHNIAAAVKAAANLCKI